MQANETRERIDMKAVRNAVAERWAEQGECRSCGWHAAIVEYGTIVEDDVNLERGTVELPCLTRDADVTGPHRGVRISIADVLATGAERATDEG